MYAVLQRLPGASNTKRAIYYKGYQGRHILIARTIKCCQRPQIPRERCKPGLPAAPNFKRALYFNGPQERQILSEFYITRVTRGATFQDRAILEVFTRGANYLKGVSASNRSYLSMVPQRQSYLV